ncbi:MAG: DUF805 domain-containing protein [Candidatus Dadabacteria bacterium]|nr:DUF805 domain-containing protein [Candidatus Dadabacteria bacterium]
MSFQQSIKTCMAKYAVFSGRASRREFWWFYLFALLINSGASTVYEITSTSTTSEPEIIIIYLIFTLIFLCGQIALFCPWIAVTTRRLHDTGRSGWLQLIPIVSLFWLAQDTQKSDNKYGPYENINV